MTLTEIKKALYKEKPIATLTTKDEQEYRYVTLLESINDFIAFRVPTKDMGDHRFKDDEPAHLLIRWIEL